MKLYLFGFLPLGRHTIRITKVEASRREPFTEETGTLIKTWNHQITRHTDPEGRTIYQDALTRDAGPLTPVVIFAQVLIQGFYRYRQARWRSLATGLERKAT